MLCCVCQSRGQHAYTFRHLTTKDGLSYNLVNALYQDREGYIWVGTFNGLNRYDGARFETFKHDRGNPASLIHNNIMDLCEDREGNIWIATQGGVSKYLKTTNAFVNYVLESDSTSESQDNMAYNILCDRKGTVYVTSLGGLFEFIPAKNTFKAYRYAADVPQSLTNNRIARNAFEQDRTQPWLWMGTEKGLNCFDTETKTFYNYRHNPKQLEIFNDHPVFPLTINRYHQVVFADNQAKKLGYYSPQTQAVHYSNEVINDPVSQPSTFLTDLFFDAQDNFWVSAWNFTVQVKEAKTGTWHQVRHSETNPSSLNSNFFWDALQARDGTVYIGGLYGLAVYKPASSFFSLYSLSENFPFLKQPMYFNGITEDQQGRLWVDHANYGLFSYDFATGRYTHFKPPSQAGSAVDNNHIRFINGEVWVSTDRGIRLFNPQTNQYREFTGFPQGDSLRHSPINWSYQDKGQNLWFSVDRSRFYRYSFTKQRLQQYNLDSLHMNPMLTTQVKAVAEAPDGTLWFGTYSGGLYEYTPAKDRFTLHLPNPKQTPKLMQLPINGILIDKKGMVWMATEGNGLVKFDPAQNTYQSWMESDGLVMDVCHSITADRRGCIWVRSYEGISVFDPVHEKILNPKIDYGQHANDYFSRGITLLRDGRIAFLNSGNLIVIEPERLLPEQAIPSPVISSIAVFEKSRPLYQGTSSIELSYQENFFTLQFAPLASPLEKAVEYSYRLENYDAKWTVTGNRNFAAYTGVKGGDYRFQVKARYKDGSWSKPVALRIYIKPPFWETGWFRALGVFLTGSAVYYGVKQRERRLLRKQKLKSRFREKIAASEMKALRAQMNPHFLYNSLNAIRLFVLQNDSDNAEKYLVKFARLMRLILANSRQEWVSLSCELEQLRLYLELEQLRFDGKFSFTLQVDPQVNPETTSIPTMIIQPFIENAILHGIAHKSGKGCISVLFSQKDFGLECMVEDDGIGLEKARLLKSKSIALHTSVGVQVTRERLRLISQRNGKKAGITLIDKKDDPIPATGTRVLIQLPLLHQPKQ